MAIKPTNKITFNNSKRDFQTDLRTRVDAYFEQNHIDRGANAYMYVKTAFWTIWAASFWSLAVASALPLPVKLLAWCALGFGFACIGFNIGHDAIHGSYSERKWINGVLSWSFDLMGANSYTWSVAHNFIHHTYTNMPGVDADLEPGPMMHFYEQPGLKPYHRYQHIYAWFLYCFISLVWLFTKDFEQILRVDPRTGKHAPTKEYVKLAIGKFLHIGFMVIVPLVVFHVPVGQLIVGNLLFHACAGVTLAVVFQLAHVVETVQFPRVPEGSTQMPEAWADHQMLTTANFGTTALATFITGGLDHQVEHHLFPKISHIHYRALAPIVKQCALDHGLPYNHSGTFVQAVGSHWRILKKLGRGEALTPAATAREPAVTLRAA